MFSQSYNLLPNKKQSFFGNSSPQNMGILGRTLTNKSYEDPGDQLNLDFETSKRNNSFSSRTNIGLMNLVYSFTEPSRFKFNRKCFSPYSDPADTSKLDCKDLLTHCNNMTTLPIARSYLVGGFVGSKSQLGRRRKSDVRKLNLWDIIRDLVNAVGSAQGNYPQKQNHHPSSMFGRKYENMSENRKWNDASNLNHSAGPSSIDEPSNSIKQSYADVAKRSIIDHLPPKPCQSEDQSPSLGLSSDTPQSVIEPFSSSNQMDFTNRDRITSECSADSEDSFIVFECCEDDNVDKDVYSSDDETISYFDEVSQSDSGIVPSSNSSFCGKHSSKKVRFAEGRSLVMVHPMVTWDYAYRMARRGPWEMLARDSERFRLRIARTEAVLKPILDPQHRSVVYRDRFSDPR